MPALCSPPSVVGARRTGPAVALAGLVACALLLAAACGSDAAVVRWRVSFSRTSDADASQQVLVRITQGECPASGEPLYEESVTRGQTAAQRAPGSLPAGEYALEGVAYDAHGSVVARGCKQVTFPQHGTVKVVLVSVDGNPLDRAPDAGGDWAVLADMPYASGALTSALLGDVLHVLGGSRNFEGSERWQDHYAYDPRSASWSSAPADVPDDDTWGARAHAHGGRLYLLGGYPSGDRLRVYDPSTDLWRSLPPPPIQFQWGFASEVVGGALYAFGGAGNAGQGYRYDFDHSSWSPVAPIPQNEGEGALASAALGGRIYVLNGNRDDGSTILQIYDTTTNRWSRGATLAGHRFEAAAAVTVGSRVYFLGGADNHDASDSRDRAGVSSALNIYDPAADRWSTGPSMGVARMWSTASYVAGSIHVFGGLDARSNQLSVHEVHVP